MSNLTLYEKYRKFILAQASYQRWVQERCEEEGNMKVVAEAEKREATFNELLEDLKAIPFRTAAPVEMNNAQPEPEPRQRFFQTLNTPSHRETIADFIKVHGGSRTIHQIMTYAKEEGLNESSIKGMLLKMVRDGELSRCGKMIKLP